MVRCPLIIRCFSLFKGTCSVNCSESCGCVCVCVLVSFECSSLNFIFTTDLIPFSPLFLPPQVLQPMSATAKLKLNLKAGIDLSLPQVNDVHV